MGDSGMKEYTKWVATWGTATSITDRKECVYAKDITLRYPIHCCFDGCKIRLHFSNLTGTEPVVISKVYADVTPVTMNGNTELVIPPGCEIVSDEIPFSAAAGATIVISMYLADCTQMNAGTLVTGPLSGGQYAYGDFALSEAFPAEVCRNTNWYYFLNTVDILTSEENRAICCYGDSITAQDWPDYLQQELETAGCRNTAIIRRAVCGTRILRQYDCITYQAYGLKGETRFPIEINVAGCDTVIIQHGINDIIHPVGVEVNRFRPMSDLPTVDDMIAGYRKFYLPYARERNLTVLSGTLLPIYGWRTYAPFREELRGQFNHWLRTADDFDGCIDFDAAVRDAAHPEQFASGFDSGDHLHPSGTAYKAMAQAAAKQLLITG